MRTKKYLLLSLVLLAFLDVHGQKPAPATTKDAVIKEAQIQLTQLSTGDGSLAVYCAENNIKGEYVMDLTIQGKGKIYTIYVVTSTADDIKYQNMLKTKLMQTHFTNIKLAKNERVKFRHTLTF